MKKSLAFMYILVVCSLLAFAFPQRAAAQNDDDPPGRVGRLSYVQGSVSFRPAGEEDWVGVVPNRPITTGDMIWADTNSRAEVRIGSATIRMDSSTGFSFLNLDDRIAQIQLSEGTLSVRVLRLGEDEIFEVDTPNQAFSIQRAGLYRFEADPDGNSTSVTVRAGEGEATGGGQIFVVHSGQTATFTGTDSLYADVVNAGGADEFDNWSEARSRRFDESRSARYVSPDVVGYEDLDDNGEWRQDSHYGHVWFPRVNAGWAPYHDGHWVWISPWGWTWVDDAPWGYAPFHYGRWVALRGRWAWVPGPIAVRAVYAPALVAFIGGSGFGVSISVGGGGGNVGWFPLGPREVYVPSYHVSERYVNRVNVSNTVVNNTTITNVYNTQVTNINTTNVTNVTNITYANKTVPGAVTAVPQRTFTSAQPVARAAVTMSAQQVAAAPVNVRTVAAPTRNSVLGASNPTGNRVAQPSAAIASRPVVAKVAPPPPPVSFARQQQALEAHPGQPLARNELQNLRPAANTPAAHPQVRQAPPGKQATPNMNRPFNQQQSQGAKPGQPAAAQPAASQPAATQPAPQPNAQPSRNIPPAGAQPNTQPTPRPNTAQPNAQPNPQPAPRPNVAQPNAQPTPQPAPPVRENRPNANQPNVQPAPRPNANQPNAQPAPQPAPPARENRPPAARPNPQPAPRPNANQPNAQPTQRPNEQPNQRPTPPARDNQAPAAQPNTQPNPRPTPPAQQVRPEPKPQPAPPAQQNHPPAQQPKPQPVPQAAPAPSHPNRPPAQEPKPKPDAKPKDKDKDKPTRPDDKPPEPHGLTQLR